MKRLSPRVKTAKLARFSRPPLERMMQLHAKLQAGAFPNCRKLADELEVSTKTIQRDIDFMRDRMGLPIEYDQLHFGFFYSEPVTHFPSIEVSEGEVVALFVAQKALAQYKGTPYEQPLTSAFRKIADGLADRISFTWSEVDGAISFRSAGASVADLELFETVSGAVLKSQELELEYRKLRGPAHEVRHVQPYHLGCVENQWYLFAFDLARKQLRTFALPRMRSARVLKKAFRRPASFSISKVLGGSFGVFRGEGKYQIRLAFDEFAARLVSERRWHDSQKLHPLADGGVEMELTLGSLEEIERWVLSWAGHVRVLAPRELRERVKTAASELLAAQGAAGAFAMSA